MRIQSLQTKWQSYLDHVLEEMPRTLLVESMSYSLNNGGKRLRPMLVLITATIKSKEALEKALPIATALEFIHTYSLIHDDLPAMDDDDYRRGELTNHKKFDEATAILAGDALQTDSFYLITQNGSLTAKQRLKCIEILSKAAGSSGMIEGQMIDMNSSSSMTLEQLRQMHFLKTGQLFVAAIEMGCVVAEFDEEITQQLIQFAMHFGIAFQIHNDLLDGLKEGTGSDEVNEKGTYVTLLGIEESRKQLEKEFQLAQQILNNLSHTTAYSFEPLNYFLNFLQDPMKQSKEVSYE